jgi:hypothetical protein
MVREGSSGEFSVGKTDMDFVFMYMMGSRWLPFEPEIGVELRNIVFFLMVPSLNYFVVLPKYKKIYPKSKFPQSKIMFIITSLAALSLFVITAGLIISSLSLT